VCVCVCGGGAEWVENIHTPSLQTNGRRPKQPHGPHL
jgi:hypothetical protein